MTETARMVSRCPICDEVIVPGDEIGMTVDQEWAHAGCAAEEWDDEEERRD